MATMFDNNKRLTDDEINTIVHALRNNARADRERIETLKAEPKHPSLVGLIETFERQATQQETLADKLEA